MKLKQWITNHYQKQAIIHPAHLMILQLLQYIYSVDYAGPIKAFESKNVLIYKGDSKAGKKLNLKHLSEDSRL